MKTVAAHASRLIAARDRQYARHARQITMKLSIETGHLWQLRKAPMKELGQSDLLRHVLGVECAQSAQCFEHRRREALVLVVIRAALHDPVRYSAERDGIGAGL